MNKNVTKNYPFRASPECGCQFYIQSTTVFTFNDSLQAAQRAAARDSRKWQSLLPSETVSRPTFQKRERMRVNNAIILYVYHFFVLFVCFLGKGCNI